MVLWVVSCKTGKACIALQCSVRRNMGEASKSASSHFIWFHFVTDTKDDELSPQKWSQDKDESPTSGSVPACQRGLGASPWCVAAAEIGVKVGAQIPATDTNQINRKYCKSFATDQIPCGASKIKKSKVKEGSIGNQASMYAISTGSSRESAKVKLFLFLTPLPPQIPMRLSFCRLIFFWN